VSIFETVELSCPSCAEPVSFEMVHSVNAARRPDLRAAILDRSFQRQECPACGYTVRMEPEFTYLDVGRKQFIAVWPAARLGEWPALEQRAMASFDKAFGPGSDARTLGATMSARVVFGWAGLSEKLVAAEAGIDDRSLELAKVAVIRCGGEIRIGPDRELRLLGADADRLVLGWLRTSSEELEEELGVPRTLLAEIEAAPQDWQDLRAEVVGPMFVDFRRPMAAA
jgi:endogenous inhibitor of DNA gyrase (YacG/DUF329 family)